MLQIAIDDMYNNRSEFHFIYNFDFNNYEINPNYVAFGVFSIVASDGIDNFNNYITNETNNKQFVSVFTKQLSSDVYAYDINYNSTNSIGYVLDDFYVSDIAVFDIMLELNETDSSVDTFVVNRTSNKMDIY